MTACTGMRNVLYVWDLCFGPFVITNPKEGGGVAREPEVELGTLKRETEAGVPVMLQPVAGARSRQGCRLIHPTYL